jgi:hypothetical protein
VVHVNVTDTRQPSELPSSLWRHSPGTPRPAPSCATAMESTGRCFQAEFSPWGCTRSRSRHGRRDRIRTWSTSSAPCAGSASITWWC